jgi:hypothetical protein
LAAGMIRSSGADEAASGRRRPTPSSTLPDRTGLMSGARRGVMTCRTTWAGAVASGSAGCRRGAFDRRSTGGSAPAGRRGPAWPRRRSATHRRSGSVPARRGRRRPDAPGTSGYVLQVQSVRRAAKEAAELRHRVQVGSLRRRR